MNNKEFEDLFYKVPEGVDYADILEDVDLEDVPEETIQKLTSLLDSDDDYIRFQVSRLLTIWVIRCLDTDVQSRAIRVDDFASSVWL